MGSVHDILIGYVGVEKVVVEREGLARGGVTE